MTFVAERLPLELEQRVKAKWTIDAVVVRRGGGNEHRNRNWDQPLMEWDASYGVNTMAQLAQLQEHWLLMGGVEYTWLFKDFSNYKIGDYVAGTKSFVALGDGADTTFQSVKRYAKSALTFDLEVYKIVANTDRVWINSTELTRVGGAPAAGQYSIDTESGIITTGDTPGGPGSGGDGAGGEDVVYMAAEFDHIVRFKDPDVDWITHHEDLHRLPSVPIVSTRNEATLT
jgi:uncharacterized protein (TIGR02217 family)